MRWKAAVIVLSLFFTVGCGFGLLEMEKASYPPLNIKKLSIKNSSLEISLPFEVKNLEVPEAKEYEYYIDQFVSKSGDNGDVWIIINGASYKQQRIEADSGQPFIPDLDKVLSMGIDNMKNKSTRIKEVTIDSKKSITNNGTKGWLIDGSFTYHGRKTTSVVPASHIQGVAFSKGADVWSILIGCQRNDTVGEKLMSVIINSIMIQ